MATAPLAAADDPEAVAALADFADAMAAADFALAAAKLVPGAPRAGSKLATGACNTPADFVGLRLPDNGVGCNYQYALLSAEQEGVICGPARLG